MTTNYYAETLSSVDIPTTAALQQAWFRDKMVANANYSLVEEFDLTVSSVPYHVVVVKCTGKDGAPDWHYTTIRTVSSGISYFLLSEEYNPTGRLFGKYVFYQNYGATLAVGTANGQIDPTSGAMVGTVAASACLGTTNSPGFPRQFGMSAAPGISSQLSLVVYDDHIAYSGSMVSPYYVGSIDSLVTTVADVGPVVAMRLNTGGGTSSTTTSSGATRHPNISTVGATAKQPLAIHDALTGYTGEWQRTLEAFSVLTLNDRNIGGAPFSPVLAWMTGGHPASGNYGHSNGLGGALRGRYRRLAMSAGVDGLVRGDTITHKATTWVCLYAVGSGSTGAIWADTGIAA